MAQRVTAIEGLFQVFSGGTPEKLRGYAIALGNSKPTDLAVACARLIERWTKTTVPPVGVILETVKEIASERIARGDRYTLSASECRELVKRRLAALREDHGDRTYGISSRGDPNDERWIKAHWEQFQGTLHWPPYSA